jgi:hypothetical protein
LFGAKNHLLLHRIPNLALELDMFVTTRALHAHIVEQVSRAKQTRRLDRRSAKCALVKIQLDRRITPELKNTQTCLGSTKKKNVTKHDQCRIVRGQLGQA